MKKYICDCEREFTDPDGPILCAQNNHGEPRKTEGDGGAAFPFEELQAHLRTLAKMVACYNCKFTKCPGLSEDACWDWLIMYAIEHPTKESESG